MDNLNFEILNDNMKDKKRSVQIAKKYFNSNSSEEKSIERLQNLIDDKNYRVFVAKFRNEVIGLVYACVSSRILSDTKLATLWCLCVDEKFRNKGVANKLLKFACEECSKLNCNEIKLTTAKSNIPCQKVAENVGFNQHYVYTKEL